MQDQSQFFEIKLFGLIEPAGLMVPQTFFDKLPSYWSSGSVLCCSSLFAVHAVSTFRPGGLVHTATVTKGPICAAQIKAEPLCVIARAVQSVVAEKSADCGPGVSPTLDSVAIATGVSGNLRHHLPNKRAKFQRKIFAIPSP